MEELNCHLLAVDAGCTGALGGVDGFRDAHPLVIEIGGGPVEVLRCFRGKMDLVELVYLRARASHHRRLLSPQLSVATFDQGFFFSRREEEEKEERRGSELRGKEANVGAAAKRLWHKSVVRRRLYSVLVRATRW